MWGFSRPEGNQQRIPVFDIDSGSELQLINYWRTIHDSFLRCLHKLWSGVFSACAVKISAACLPERETLSGSPQGALFSQTHTCAHTQQRTLEPADIVALIHPLATAASPQPPPPLAFSPSPCFFCPSTLLPPPPLHHPQPQTTSILGFRKVEKQSDGQTDRMDSFILAH